MSLTTLFTLALGLSSDAFAVSLGRGASGRIKGVLNALRMGALFGFTEGIMALAGYLLATSFADFITAFDHWVAFFLLGAVGGHMIYESFQTDYSGEKTGFPDRNNWLTNLATSIGTSIDSAAVGVALSFIAVNIWQAVLVIGSVSFVMSTIGMLIGPRVGNLLGKRAELIGGVLLICIGTLILYDHTAGP